VSEAVLALRLEHRLTKREILALYLNLASYGNQLIGAERAGVEYFGRGAAMLTPAQAAFLAALPQRPTAFNPYLSTVRAADRQRYILQRMASTGRLTRDELARALAENIGLKQEPAAFIAPHFVQQVLSAVAARPAPDRHGRIVTTLDAELQREVQGIVRSQRLTLDRHGAHNVAVAVLDNASGGWLAWEGSGDYDDRIHGGAIDGVVAPRQPGSALKPFTYALAFESGDSPATVLPDVPSYFPTAESGVAYRPANYDGRFRGPLLARAALAGSENVPAVVMASRVGVPNLVRFLRNAGLSTLDKTAAHYGLGLTLGDAEVRLDELVAAYAAFARGGRVLQPTFFPGTGAADGGDADLDGSHERLVSPRTAFWITDILSDDRARAYAFGRDSSLEFPFAVAAKTGTSQAYRDNWVVGYTKAVTVGVWVGNFDRTPLVGSSGVTGAGPIFHAVMTAAVRHLSGQVPFDEGTPTTARPAAVEGMERRAVCALSGMAAGPHCPSQIDEWTAREVSMPACDWHLEGRQGGTVVAWPSEYRSWARERGLLAGNEAMPARAVHGAARRGTQSAASTAAHDRDGRTQRAEEPSGEPGVVILNPPSGATYLVDPTLRPEFQTLGLRATSPAGGAIAWQVDGRPIGSSASDERFEWPLTRGAHTITALDRQGRRAEAAIVVK
jgi:penicillin-binding protein 1C